ncbi:hypothetical protein LSH36_10g05008 [Paralvinella palmiformis]|uniref:Uncharacterized protein n=1 Tax=Paralvinella palmiformis TaxID=53620 RepID=A0AAD9KCW8_9ANNE|nr:hypothetical protein LSH36_10g05008 [Paralvinella palmiformis]
MHNILAAFIEEFLLAIRYFGSLGHGADGIRVKSEPTAIPGCAPPGGRQLAAPSAPGYVAVEPSGERRQPAGTGYDPMRAGQGAQAARTYAPPPVARERSPAHGQGQSPGSARRCRRSSVTAAWDTILRQEEPAAGSVDVPDRYPEDYADYRRPRLTGPDGYLRAAQSDPDWTGRDELAAHGSGYLSSEPGSLGRVASSAANGHLVSSTKMGCCSKKNVLTVMTSTCASASFAFLCIAVATDYWLHAKELKQAANGSQFYEYTYTGLWRKCSANVRPNSGHVGRCVVELMAKFRVVGLMMSSFLT